MRAAPHSDWSPWIALGAIILATSAPADAYGASPREPRRWLVQVASGVNTMQLAEVKDFYGAALDYYRDNGMPLETQREFPPNLILGADLLFEPTHDIWIGLGSRYTWTRAYTLYEDFAGTLDVVGRMRLVALQLVVQKAWSGAGPWSPFVELRAGRGFVSIRMSEKIVLTQYAPGEAEAVLDGDGSAPLAELHVGTRHARGRYLLAVSGGYRYCNVPGPPFDLDVSGFVGSMSMGWSLR